MFRKTITIFLSMILLLGLVSCEPIWNQESDDSTKETNETTKPSTETTDNTTESLNQNQGDTPSVEMTTIPLNSSTPGIKILGERYVESATQINCDWTCSGIEFNLNSAGGIVSFSVASDKNCYFRAFVDGESWRNTDGEIYFKVCGIDTINLKAIPAGQHTVRLIKVTGHTLAPRVQLYDMSFYGTISPTAPADKDLYIEFIGDSISCGYGVMGAFDGTYSSQDGALAYPYLLAERLNADYSITALSGQGVIFHGTGFPNLTNGYLLTSPLRDEDQEYDFQRKADMVVINIGTNDYNRVTDEEFKTAYVNLISTVKRQNGADCKVICLYNSMNDTCSASILAACEQLGGESNGIYVQSLPRCAGHPTASEHQRFLPIIEPIAKKALQIED